MFRGDPFPLIQVGLAVLAVGLIFGGWLLAVLAALYAPVLIWTLAVEAGERRGWW